MTAPMLDASTLARFRDMQDANMPSTADLIVFALSRQPGGITEKLPTIVATVPCRIAVTASSLPLLAEQPTLVVQHTITLPLGTDLTGVERIVVHGVDAIGVAWTAEMIIDGIPEPRSYSASIKVLARRAADTLVSAPSVATVTITDTP